MLVLSNSLSTRGRKDEKSRAKAWAGPFGQCPVPTTNVLPDLQNTRTMSLKCLTPGPEARKPGPSNWKVESVIPRLVPCP